MSELDDFLSSLGIEDDASATTQAIEQSANLLSALAGAETPPRPQVQQLSQDDVDEILQDNGFVESPEMQEAEEVHDEYDENIGEGRDLDAEEDADWDRLEQAGVITSASVSEQEPIYVGDGIMAQIRNTPTISGTLTRQDLIDNLANCDLPSTVLTFDGENTVAPDGTIVAGRDDLSARAADASEYVLDLDSASREVHFHMPNGSVVDVPVVTDASIAEGEDDEEEDEELEWEDADDAAPAETAGTTTTSVPTELPMNSPTLLLDESTTRFSGAEWYNDIQKKSIIVAGQGGIGSNLSFQLARMHPAALYLYDDDYVETVNMAGQLYARTDVGKAKVSAIADMITGYTNMQNVYAIQQKFTSNTEAGNIMMCGFDNMKARYTFFHAWRHHVSSLPEESRKECLYLDGRLSMTVLQVFCITGDDEFNKDRYMKEFLFSDSEAEHTVCSLKQTTYLACMIGSVMTNLFTNWVANTLEPVIPYDLPFFTEYDAQNMIFKTEM